MNRSRHRGFPGLEGKPSICIVVTQNLTYTVDLRRWGDLLWPQLCLGIIVGLLTNYHWYHGAW